LVKLAVPQFDSTSRSLWYQQRVRLFASIAVMAVCVAGCVAGCGQPSGPSSSSISSAPSSQSVEVKPANIARVRSDLPAGYELADIADRTAPVAMWGFGPGWTAEPPQCGALADPVADGAVTRGWSGSGSGGIVYAVVTGSPPAPVGLDPALLVECGHWTLSAGHTSGSVTFVAAPAIEGVATVGLSTAVTTVVEGGTETRSHSDTFIAYLGDYVAFVTVVADPGSPTPALGADFASELLVKTVSALRS
jgi:Domain of unknown function (DUF5642)